MSTAVSGNSSVDIAVHHQALVDLLIQNKCIRSETVAAAFRAVPRHPFLPGTPLEEVYSDTAIPTHFDDDGHPVSSSSQPAIMAIMLEQLALQPGQHVLEVGTGTGYNAALMGYLVGAHGRVTTLDIDPSIVAAASDHLAAAGCSNVTAICGDGMVGCATHAPYDRIILTVGGWDIAPAWREQLKPDGRMLLPLSLNGPQYAVAFDQAEECLVSASVHPCGFMRLRGPHAGPDITFPLNDEQTIHLDYEEALTHPRQLDPGRLRAWLTGPSYELTTNLQISPREVWRGLMLWLALHEPKLAGLTAGGAAVTAGAIPLLLGANGPKPWQTTIGVVTDDGMAFYMRQPVTNTGSGEPETFVLGVCGYGPGSTAGQLLQDHAHAWHLAGRPGESGMRVRAYPVNNGLTMHTAVTRRWHKFVVDWLPPS